MSNPWADDIPADTPYLLDQVDVPTPAQRPMDHRAQPKKKDKGPIPARQSNGYYADHATGDRLRSVTTILSGGVPKPGLVFWAGNMCTDSAIEHLPQLVAASRNPEQLAEMRSFITRAHTRKKDERAEVGSAVHTIIECRLLGLELPSSVMVGDQEWAFDGPELAPFIEHFLDFEAKWQPVWTASEMVVANPVHGYAGTLDYTISAAGPIGDALRAYVEAMQLPIEVPPGEDIMGDTKTGGEFYGPDGESPKLTSAGHVHGVYPEAGLQMSAYRNAKTAWLRDGSRVLMPPTAAVGIVLHLRPEGFRIYPTLCGDREYQYFRHAQMVDEWSSRLASARADRPIVGPALVLPASAGRAVA